MNITQEDIFIAKQKRKTIYVKIELLNRNFKIIDVMEGELLNDSYTIDSMAETRRTYTCSFLRKDSSFSVGYDKKIWLNNFIRPYVGIENNRTNIIKWYLMGTFIINNPSQIKNETEDTLSLTCSDLMSTLNGSRNGEIGDSDLTIKAGSIVVNVISAILQEANICKYIINMDNTLELPYDLNFSTGVTYYDVLKDILNLYPMYQMYFDVNGIFNINKIPIHDEDLTSLDEDIFNYNLISEESVDIDFDAVYNHVQVWGQVIKGDRMAQSCSLIGDTYISVFENFEHVNDYENYAFDIPISNGENFKISINNEIYPIVNDNNEPLFTNTLPAGINIFQYHQLNNALLWLGQTRVFGESYVDNNSSFAISKIGKITKVLSGGDYDNIYSCGLAEQRAKYEVYVNSRLNDIVVLNMIQIPWLDVNIKIKFKDSYYIIQSIQGSAVDALMTVTLSKFYNNIGYI